MIPKKDRVRIIGKIQSLAGNPRPMGYEKLSGKEQYRVRHGRYRIVYSISDLEQTVLLVKVAQRKEAYR